MATHKISDNELIETLAFIGVMWVFYHADKEGLNLTFNEIVERVFPSLAGDENERLAIVLEEFFARKEPDFVYSANPSRDLKLKKTKEREIIYQIEVKHGTPDDYDLELEQIEEDLYGLTYTGFWGSKCWCYARSRSLWAGKIPRHRG